MGTATLVRFFGGEAHAATTGGGLTSDVPPGKLDDYYGLWSGGQSGDNGVIEWPGGDAEVIDVRKHAGDLHVLVAQVTAGKLEIGTRAAQLVDAEKRRTTRANHSAAHSQKYGS